MQKLYSRILFIHPVLATYSCVFFNKLEEVGFDVLVAADVKTSNPLNQYKDNDCKFEVVHLENRKVGPFFYRPGLGAIIQNSNADLVVYLGNPRDVSQLFSMFKDWLHREKFAVWSMFHRIGGPRLYSELIYKLIGKIAAINLCYSRVGALSQICRGVLSKKVFVLGTAIDEKKVFSVDSSIGESEVEKFKEENGLKGKKVVLQVVRLSKIKEPERLVEAMKYIVNINSNVLAVLIGGGELFSKIQSDVEKSGLSQNVRLLGPIYDEEILAKWYRVCDVFVVPTCIGLSVHHAMAYGCTVVTDNDYAKQASEFELIVDGFTGRIYDPWIPNNLAKTLLDIVEGKNEVISEFSKNSVKFGYSLSQKAQNFKQAMDRLEVIDG